MKVKLTFAGEETIVQMENMPAAQDFLTLLPLKLTFEDYASTEKVSYLARKLTTEGEPRVIEASRGDLTYYAPWGNLALFYKDFGYSTGLVKLGTLTSGIEKFEKLIEDFEVVIQRMDE